MQQAAGEEPSKETIGGLSPTAVQHPGVARASQDIQRPPGSAGPHVQRPGTGSTVGQQQQQVPLRKGRRTASAARTTGRDYACSHVAHESGVGAERSEARKTRTCSASSMVQSGGISIAGASTGVSCAPSSASSVPVSFNCSEREGDEEERELVDKVRRSTTVPAAGTLCSSTGSLADASSESSVPGTSASSVDIREEAPEADDVEPGPV
ncbi:hypothetical protein MRX96_029871 [Rhipicephalus microplus]